MSLAIKAGRAASGGRLREELILEQRLMGDPGLFGFLKKVGKKALGVGAGFLTGGIGGAAAGLIGGGGGRPPSPGVPMARGIFQGVPAPQTLPVVRTPGVRGAVQRALPGGRTGFEVQAPGMNGAPKGMRLNKSSYFLRDGTFVPKGTRWVKIRRRNSLNPRALDRAIGRVVGAKKAAKKLGRITVRKDCPR